MRKAKITFLVFLFSIMISFPYFAMNVLEDFSQDYGGFGCSGYKWGIYNSENYSVESRQLINYPRDNLVGWGYLAWIDCSGRWSFKTLLMKLAFPLA